MPPSEFMAVATFGSPVIFAGFLAIVTGLLIVACPNIIYYLVAGHLLIIGIVGYALGMDPGVSIAAIVAGLLIFIFPKLIPYLFAVYLIAIAVFAFYAGGFGLFVALPALIAVLLLARPNIVAYSIACYFILNGLVILLGPVLA